MNLEINIAINLYSIIILLVLCVQAGKSFDMDFLRDRLFICVLYITIFMLIFDVMSRFDGHPDTVYPVLNAVGNFMVFLMLPVLPSLWLVYVHFQICHEEAKVRRLLTLLGAGCIIYASLFIGSRFHGWLYDIDPNNIYHRGPLFFLNVLIILGFFIVTSVMVFVNRKRLEKKSYASLLFFALPPCAGVILQTAFYGLSLALNGVVLSIFVVFLNIQSQSIYTDYLTGVNNRKKLDLYLKRKISTSIEGKSFSVILLDINDFKYINDTFGHDVGDNALETATTLLKSCIRNNDFIARFGGDEFCIILDISSKAELEALVSRIHHCTEKHNESGNRPYRLGFSIGYAVYEPRYRSAEEFLKQADSLMYEDKQSHKCRLPSS